MIYGEFANKVAVVTGGTDGIGKAVAYNLAALGTNLVILSRNTRRLEEIKNELTAKYSVRIHCLRCDVGILEDVEKTVQKMTKLYQSIDYLINNAGFSSSKSVSEVTIDDFDSEIRSNLRGSFLMTMAVYPMMKNGGSIIMMSSDRGRRGSSTSSPGYAGAKAGIIAMTKTFALQLGQRHIRVNCIAPSAIYPTGMSRKWSESKRADIASSLPIGRLGSPEDVAHATLFLLSDQAGFITGQTLDVNGGVYMN